MNGCGSATRLALDRDLALLHRLEQRRLRLGGRAVDFVGEHDVREDRPCAQDERAVAAARDVGAGDVGGQQIGRELDAPEVAAERGRERLDERRLRDAGHALEQHVPSCQEADEQESSATSRGPT